MQIRLEPFNKFYYPALISWVNGAEMLMQFAGPALHFPLTAAQLDDALSDVNRHAYAVINTATGEAIGHGEVYLKSDIAYLGRIMVGDERLRGQGSGLQIVCLLLDIAFNGLGQSKAALNVFDWNTSAIRCYEKAGFRINPGMTQERIINGQIWNALNMVLDKERWISLT